jgi:hypothetical protein
MRKDEVKSLGTVLPPRRAMACRQGRFAGISNEEHPIALVAKRPTRLSHRTRNVVLKDEVKSLGTVLPPHLAMACCQGRFARISNEEHPKTFVAKRPTRLSHRTRIRNVVQKIKNETLSLVRSAPRAVAFSVGIAVEEHSVAFTAKSPRRLSVHDDSP